MRHPIVIVSLFAMTTAMLLPAHGQTPPPISAPTSAVAPDPAAPAFDGLDLAGMDRSASPCQDLWSYANGNYLKHVKIPEDRHGWGVDYVIEERNNALLHQILNDAARRRRTAAVGSADQKVGDLFYAGMDMDRIDAQGTAPLAPDFARIAAIRDRADLMATIGKLHTEGYAPLFDFFVAQDARDSKHMIAQLYQGGLGMPERDYYLSSAADKRAIRRAYGAYAAAVFRLMGDAAPRATAEAQTVLALETRLAKASMTPVEERDPVATYHARRLADLQRDDSGAAWARYFAAIGLAQPGRIDVSQPAFVREAARAVATVPLDQWNTYLRWCVINRAAPYLSRPFADAHFGFYQTTLNGVHTQQPRWKRVLAVTDDSLGELLGRLYVARAFTPEAKARALALVQNIRSALRDRIETLDWMSPATRKQALAKLDRLTIKIGYPDKWRDYSSLHIVASDAYFTDVEKSDAWDFRRDLAKVGKAPDRSEWGMTPPTVNAYYDDNWNQIVFPAGILQPPYFDPRADDAVNYGQIGATIGHEITHGFDDEGRQYDADGTLRDWWTPADARSFDARAQQIVKRFDAYVAVDDQHVNGKLTLGENIADRGGLKIAYLALEKSLAGKPRPAPIDGFTVEQRFFIAYAQSWREVRRPASIRTMIATDPHSPERFRVLGAVADLPDFESAFHCPEASGKGSAASSEIW